MAEVHGDPQAVEGVDGTARVVATLEYLARSLVDHPEDVSVTTAPDGGRTLVSLEVHPDDAGRVIGRGGRVARAIRMITKAAAARAGISIFVQIAGGSRARDAQAADTGSDTGSDNGGS